ncbi:MAG TPA: RDD family protein [Vicinamibacterales bacterium]
MKCPKCSYIGFETGDRCKNCGYEFALMRDADDIEAVDLVLRAAESTEPAEPDMTPALPLFRAEDVDDEPLVRVTPPRPPVAVRKTPDAHRMRLAPSVPAESSMRDAVFEFGSEPSVEPATVLDLDLGPRQPLRHEEEPAADMPILEPGVDAVEPFTPVGPRMLAALIDHGLLLAIDAIVIYFTLRLTALTLADWRVVPAAPLLTFLVGLKLAYFSAFTFAGGQTIGKMAAGIKVVADDDTPLDPWQVVRRSIVGVASLVALGAPFLIALPDPARRGLHDRVARTRVVPVS